MKRISVTEWYRLSESVPVTTDTREDSVLAFSNDERSVLVRLVVQLPHGGPRKLTEQILIANLSANGEELKSELVPSVFVFT